MEATSLGKLFQGFGAAEAKALSRSEGGQRFTMWKL